MAKSRKKRPASRKKARGNSPPTHTLKKYFPVLRNSLSAMSSPGSSSKVKDLSAVNPSESLSRPKTVSRDQASNAPITRDFTTVAIHGQQGHSVVKTAPTPSSKTSDIKTYFAREEPILSIPSTTHSPLSPHTNVASKSYNDHQDRSTQVNKKLDTEDGPEAEARLITKENIDDDDDGEEHEDNGEEYVDDGEEYTSVEDHLDAERPSKRTKLMAENPRTGRRRVVNTEASKQAYCIKCESNFCDQETYDSHREICGAKWFCRNCKVNFSAAELSENHAKACRTHLDTQCTCGAWWESNGGLRHYYTTRHKKLKIHLDMVACPGPKINPEPERPRCTTCTGTFATISLFLAHYEACKSGELFCRECKTLFEDNAARTKHLPKCRPVKDQCGKCLKFTNHLGNHKFCKETLQCHQCGKSVSKRNFPEHLKNQCTASGRSILTCGICSVSMFTYHLTDHIREVHTGPFWICTVPGCKRNVVGHRFSKKAMRVHMKEIHLDQAGEFPPRQELLPLPHQNIPTKDQIKAFLTSVDALADIQLASSLAATICPETSTAEQSPIADITNLAARGDWTSGGGIHRDESSVWDDDQVDDGQVNNDQEDNNSKDPAYVNDEFDGGEDDEDDGSMLFEIFHPESAYSGRPLTVSKEKTSFVLRGNTEILLQNRSLWGKARLATRDQRCIGPRRLSTHPDCPSIGLMYVQEQCPRETLLDLDNALLKRAIEGHLVLAARCIECAAELAITDLLQEKALLVPDNVVQSNCISEDCSYPCLYRSRYCVEHTRLVAMGRAYMHIPKIQNLETAKAIRTQATRKMWALDEISRFEVFLARKNTGTRAFALDLEGALWANELSQVALVDTDTDRVLCNLSIQDPMKTLNAERKINSRNPSFERLVCRLGARIQPPNHSGQRVKNIEAAKINQSLGLTPSDHIVVWHRSFADYTVLRRLLVSVLGEHAVNQFFPPQSNVIRPLFRFKHNLGKLASGSLELLFRLYFPTHELTGDHHDAEIDAVKLAMMARLGENYVQGDGKIHSQLLDWATGGSAGKS